MDPTPQSQLKLLIQKGKEQGYLTFAEVNDHLPQDIIDSDQVEDIISMINDMGIKVSENAPDADELMMQETTTDEDAAEADADEGTAGKQTEDEEGEGGPARPPRQTETTEAEDHAEGAGTQGGRAKQGQGKEQGQGQPEPSSTGGSAALNYPKHGSTRI